MTQLERQGLVYPAYETAEELDRQRRALRAQGKAPVYDRAALGLSAGERRALETAGRRPHWRFRLSGEAARWTDLVQGEVAIPGGSLSDPVLRKADGDWTYTLASAADDVALGVTHIIRGDDHRTNTAVQLELLRALGGAVPTFAHLPLLTGPGGAPLSKRSGDWSLADYRARGIEPHAVRLVLAALGTDRAAVPEATLEDLVRGFDLGRFGRGSAVFDEEQLARTSAAVFQSLPLEAVRRRPGLAGLAAEEWALLRQNATSAADLAAWRRLIEAPVAPVIEEPAFLAEAARLLPATLPDAAAATAWLDAVKRATGRKGRALFHPLRLALTARDDGPKLADLLPILGRERVYRRLTGETA
jgi:glutamyl-tRNA synthetase